MRLPWRARLRREDLVHLVTKARRQLTNICLLYTSDAADDLLCVDLGGRRLIKKKKKIIQKKKNNHTTE